MRLGRAIVLLVAFLVASGCTDGEGDASAPPPRFAVADAPGWDLQQAVDPPAADPVAAVDRPPLDWYAEYGRDDATEMVRLSGHDASLAEARSSLEEVGFAFDEAEVDGHDEALVGWQEADPSGPAVVLLGAGSRVLVLLSYELDGAALTTFGGSVRTVDEQEWIDAGGVVR